MGRRGRSNLSDESFFFVTTTVVKFVHVFDDPGCCDLLVRNIKHYQQRYKFVILGYAIMPSHFHWIVEVEPKLGTISDVMRDIKKYSAWDILQRLDQQGRADFLTIFKEEAVHYRDQRQKLWMKRFDDEVIRNQGMFREKLKYIHENPVRAGLAERPEEYRYSSARNYICGDHSVLHVDTSMGL